MEIRNHRLAQDDGIALPSHASPNKGGVLRARCALSSRPGIGTRCRMSDAQGFFPEQLPSLQQHRCRRDLPHG